MRTWPFKETIRLLLKKLLTRTHKPQMSKNKQITLLEIGLGPGHCHSLESLFFAHEQVDMSGRGRGRGRGRGAVPPSVAAAGPFGRGDSSTTAPSTIAMPKAEPGVRYPTTSLPQPVDALTEADRQMIKNADILTQYMRSSPFFLAPANTQTLKVDRYSDKYLTHLQLEERKGKIFAIDTGNPTKGSMFFDYS